MAVFIFHIGSVLLAIITFVYILYANSFLMTMRQKDYAMFMMLGAKGRKIAQMIFAETFVVGAAATLIGSAFGVGLTSVVQRILVSQLNITIAHYTPFNLNVLITTIVFFAILFLLAAFVNAFSIVKKPILTLIRADETPTRMKKNKFLFLLEVVLGIVLLGMGYRSMSEILTIGPTALYIALITICLGTYFIFRSVIVFFLILLKKAENISLKKLNNFTISQLSFRIRDYTQMLSMVAILFALALGALTVGLGFRNQITVMTNISNAYDLTLNNAQKMDQEQIAKLKPTLNAVYSQKEDGQNVYYNYNEFEKNPFKYMNADDHNLIDVQEMTATAAEVAKSDRLQAELKKYELPMQQVKGVKLVSASEFNQLNLPETSLQLVKVKDFYGNLNAISTLVKENRKNNPEIKDAGIGSEQKYEMYEQYNGLFSGLEFMGFFLGIAFLAMLASCLMFKILSGSKSDIGRYTMLEKNWCYTRITKTIYST